MERGISMFEKKVCKGCGKNGFFLKLNSDLLCNECVELKNNEMSMSEVADELVKFVKGEGSAKKLTTYVELQEAKKDGKHEISILCLEIMKKREVWNDKGKQTKHFQSILVYWRIARKERIIMLDHVLF